MVSSVNLFKPNNVCIISFEIQIKVFAAVVYHWKWFSHSWAAQWGSRIASSRHWPRHLPLAMPASLRLQTSSDARTYPHVQVLPKRNNFGVIDAKWKEKGKSVTFVHWPLPQTTDALEFARRWAHVAFALLVALQWFAGENFAAELTFIGQFWDGLFHRQISWSRRLGDLNATVGASGHLVTQSSQRTEKRKVNYVEWTDSQDEFKYLPSASKCVKHAAHIKCPIWHCNEKENREDRQLARW